MKQSFKFSLQRFAGNAITGHIVRPSNGSVLSGNTLSFRNIPPPPRPFNDYTWEEISAIAQAGTGANYFNIGDCKEITLNGNIGDYLTLNDEKLCVYILHFNYPMDGIANNNIILGGFKLADDTDVALVDSQYDTYDNFEKISFSMNHSIVSINTGGWRGCHLRYDILGATSTASESGVGYDATAETLISPKENTLLAALPASFRNVLRLWSRWVDAKGGGSNTEDGIEKTIDAVTLLTEFEVHGVQTYANEYEQNHQTQMEYYRLGNSKIKYKHNTANTTLWWCSSPASVDNAFCCVYGDDDNYPEDNGTAVTAFSQFACGIAPAFKV